MCRFEIYIIRRGTRMSLTVLYCKLFTKSVTGAKIEIRRLTDERNDVHVWEALFDKACEIASEFEIETSRPPVVGRQRIM
jgi:hypothetical protein